MNVLPQLVVWAVLAAVIVVYVIFRLATDHRYGKKRHVLYPVISKPTDGMFPEHGAYLSWAVYILVSLGLGSLIAAMFLDGTGSAVPEYLLNFAALCIGVLLILFAISIITRSKGK